MGRRIRVLYLGVGPGDEYKRLLSFYSNYERRRFVVGLFRRKPKELTLAVIDQEMREAAPCGHVPAVMVAVTWEEIATAMGSGRDRYREKYGADTEEEIFRKNLKRFADMGLVVIRRDGKYDLPDMWRLAEAIGLLWIGEYFIPEGMRKDNPSVR